MRFKKIQKNSMVHFYLKWLLLFAGSVFCLFAVIYTAMEMHFDRMVSSLLTIDIEKYDKQLKNDDFEKIPLSEYIGSKIAVIDGDGKVLFSSGKNFTDKFTKNEIDCIPDIQSDEFLEISGMIRNDKQYYMVVKSHYVNGVKMMLDYALLNSEYKIIDGTMFSDKTELSKREFNFLNGAYSENRSIYKYDYINNDGEERTVVVISKTLNEDYLNNAINSAYSFWWMFIPSFFILLFVFALLISREIIRYIRPLDSAILNISRGESVDFSDYKGPKEFSEIIENFSKLSKQLERSERRRKEADSEKQRLLTDISHDLKTPITVIHGYSKAICDGLVAENTKDKYIQIISKKAETVSSLVDSFFEYSKMDHPGFSVNAQPCNFCEFCQEYLAEKYQEIDLAGFSMELDIPETAINCRIDQVLMRRVLENMLSNSIRYNPKGTKLFFSIKEKAGFAVVSFGDNGVGVPADMAKTIFDPFVVGDSSRKPGQGTGLGMAIVKKIVDAHDGKVYLAVPPQKGMSTEFVMILPIADK